jgi:hypothetical protein
MAQDQQLHRSEGSTVANVKIYTPVKDYTGTVGNVSFVNGVGETDSENPAIANYFGPAGYVVGSSDDRAGALPAEAVVNVPPVKGAGDGPMIEEVVAIEAAAEAEEPAPSRAKRAAK